MRRQLASAGEFVMATSACPTSSDRRSELQARKDAAATVVQERAILRGARMDDSVVGPFSGVPRTSAPYTPRSRTAVKCRCQLTRGIATLRPGDGGRVRTSTKR